MFKKRYSHRLSSWGKKRCRLEVYQVLYKQSVTDADDKSNEEDSDKTINADL